MATIFKRKGAKKYTIRWTDHTGKRRERRGYSDKAKTRQLANQLEDEARQRRDGLIDPEAEAWVEEERKAIAAHLADYEAHLRAGGRDDQHINQTIAMIRRFSTETEVESIADIGPIGVNHFSNQMKDRGSSARTIQAHVTAIAAFASWLAAHSKLRRDPLRGRIHRPNPASDRRQERRMLLPEEWAQLCEYLSRESCPVNFGMGSQERLLLYATAIQTGLRAGELRSLTKRSLFLDMEPPFVLAKAAGTKNKKDARQYIKRDLARGLRVHVKTARNGTPVFSLPRRDQMADMLRADIAAARSMWLEAIQSDTEEHAQRRGSEFLLDVNHAGEKLDFHSLRHTCGAWLALAGAHPKAVQTLMRHSTITLTMDTYGHLFPGQEAETVSRFPEMLPPVGGKSTHLFSHLPNAPVRHDLSPSANGASRPASDNGRRKSRRVKDKATRGHRVALSDSKWAEKDSNLRRHTPTDLQSVPFGRLGIRPEG
jgi:integrase